MHNRRNSQVKMCQLFFYSSVLSAKDKELFLLEYFHTATGFTCKSDIAVRRKVNGVACVLDVGAVQQLTELVVDEYSGVVRTFDSDTLSDHILPDPIPCGFTAVKRNFGGISGKHREGIHTAAARSIAQVKGDC